MIVRSGTRSHNARLRALYSGLWASVLLGMASSAFALPRPRCIDRERVERIYVKSRDAYRQGHFSEAAELLREALSLCPDATLYYNLARALEGTGDTEGAIGAYERYLSTNPDAQDRAIIAERIAMMRRQLADRSRLEEERRQALVREERARQVARERAHEDAELRANAARANRRRGLNVVPWITAGVGTVVLGTGITFGALAVSRDDDARHAQTQSEAVSLRKDATSYAKTANVCFAVGGTLAAAGVAWGLINLFGSHRRHDVVLGPGTLFVSGNLR